MGAVRCRICGSESDVKHHARMLGRYDMAFHQCGRCGFMQTEHPYWLDEAYAAAINAEDTGILQRSLTLRDKVTPILLTLFDPHGRFLDYGGGYGIFTRLMRDRGFDFYWHDPKAQNLFARYFEYREDIGNIDLVTTIECFEHFVHPMAEIERILGFSRNVFFTTQLLPDPAPAPDAWSYYGLSHGQHISFYTLASLRHIADTCGLHLNSDGAAAHLLTKEPIDKRSMRRAWGLHGAAVRRLMKGLVSKTQSDSDDVASRRTAGDRGR